MYSEVTHMHKLIFWVLDSDYNAYVPSFSLLIGNCTLKTVPDEVDKD